MSLQTLNEEFQLELIERDRPKTVHASFGKFKLNSIGSLFKREYPDARRLEELLVGFD
jgi:hypothetical protein